MAQSVEFFWEFTTGTHRQTWESVGREFSREGKVVIVAQSETETTWVYRGTREIKVGNGITSVKSINKEDFDSKEKEEMDLVASVKNEYKFGNDKMKTRMDVILASEATFAKLSVQDRRAVMSKLGVLADEALISINDGRRGPMKKMEKRKRRRNLLQDITESVDLTCQALGIGTGKSLLIDDFATAVDPFCETGRQHVTCLYHQILKNAPYFKNFLQLYKGGDSWQKMEERAKRKKERYLTNALAAVATGNDTDSEIEFEKKEKDEKLSIMSGISFGGKNDFVLPSVSASVSESMKPEIRQEASEASEASKMKDHFLSPPLPKPDKKKLRIQQLGHVVAEHDKNIRYSWTVQDNKKAKAAKEAASAASAASAANENKEEKEEKKEAINGGWLSLSDVEEEIKGKSLEYEHIFYFFQFSYYILGMVEWDLTTDNIAAIGVGKVKYTAMLVYLFDHMINGHSNEKITMEKLLTRHVNVNDIMSSFGQIKLFLSQKEEDIKYEDLVKVLDSIINLCDDSNKVTKLLGSHHEMVDKVVTLITITTKFMKSIKDAVGNGAAKLIRKLLVTVGADTGDKMILIERLTKDDKETLSKLLEQYVTGCVTGQRSNKHYFEFTKFILEYILELSFDNGQYGWIAEAVGILISMAAGKYPKSPSFTPHHDMPMAILQILTEFTTKSGAKAISLPTTEMEDLARFLSAKEPKIQVDCNNLLTAIANIQYIPYTV